MAYDMALCTGPEDRIFLMTKSNIYTRISQASARAGLHGRYGGHSPRIGMSHDLLAGNVNKTLAMQAGRWDTEYMLGRYTRKLDALRGGVAQWYARDNNQDSPDPEPTTTRPRSRLQPSSRIRTVPELALNPTAPRHTAVKAHDGQVNPQAI